MSKKGDKPKETAEEKALAQIGLERWQDYQQRFVPVENAAIGRVMDDINNPDMQGEGLANVSTQQAFSDLENQTTRGLTLRGARAGSGAFAGGLAGVNMDRVASSGLGQAGAYGMQRGINISNLQNLVGIGQGQATGALQGLTDVADAASRQAIMDARASAASRAALGQLVGTGAGYYFGSTYGNTPTSNGTSPSGYNTTTSPTGDMSFDPVLYNPPRPGGG